LNVLESWEVYPVVDAVNLQPGVVADAVLVSVGNVALPLAFVVALALAIAHAAEVPARATDTVAPAAGCPSAIKFTVTGVAVELNGTLVMFEPVNASVGCLVIESVQPEASGRDVVYGPGGRGNEVLAGPGAPVHAYAHQSIDDGVQALVIVTFSVMVTDVFAGACWVKMSRE
jgi:hypothetical protein